jgi:hypothetical protein
MAKDKGEGAGGGAGAVIGPDVKISKIMLWPTRKINLGNYNSAEMSAGVEITFGNPVSLNSPDVEKAFNEAHKVLGAEFAKQYEPYKKLLESQPVKKGGEQ